MRRFVLFGGALCALIFGFGRSPLATTRAETMAQRQRAAEGLVAEALRGELDGADGRREELLQGALEKSPDYAPARWHTGHVQERNRWVRFDEVAKLSAEDSRLAAYRHARQQHGETVEGQMELAKWCAKRKLADRQRVHLTKVLELDPNHGEARRLLGHRYVDGGWLTPQQVTDTELRSRQAVAAMRQWKPKLASILAGLQQRSQAKREAAVERLLAIDDPAAIGAMEAVLAGHSEAAALLLVRALAEMPAAEAAVALARQALASPSEKVRDAAAEKLKSRDLHSYVPQLLGAMGSKVQSQAQLYTSPSGRLVYRHTFARKGQGHNEVAVFETEYRGTVLSAQRPEEIAASRAELGRQRQMDAVMKADFHTYFVGEAMVLSHDNSIRRPTDTIVPGLVQR